MLFQVLLLVLSEILLILVEICLLLVVRIVVVLGRVILGKISRWRVFITVLADDGCVEAGWLVV